MFCQSLTSKDRQTQEKAKQIKVTFRDENYFKTLTSLGKFDVSAGEAEDSR